MKGKVCVITGSTGGIGMSAAKGLAELGATLVLVCRNPEKGESAIRAISQATGNNNLEMLIADLSIQSEIRKTAGELNKKYQSISLLINNAGLAVTRRTLSPDGIEMTFAVNHLAYFLFTSLLLDALKAGAPSRIINVSSEAHRNVLLDFDDLQLEKRYGGFRSYSLSKLCNILFTYELARRLEGSGVTVNALHPGYLNTGIFRDAPSFLRFLVKLTAGPAERGGRAIVHLATAPELSGVTAKYFNGLKEAPSSAVSYDRASSERLWQISSELVRL